MGLKTDRFCVRITSLSKGDSMITIDDFKKLELRVADILDAIPHPNADKLYILDIQVGEVKKQIVAGIRLHYSLDELKGKKVVVVNNLEPALIRGVESQGMLLAAQDGETLGLLVPDRAVGSGSSVK